MDSSFLYLKSMLYLFGYCIIITNAVEIFMNGSD